MDKKLSLLFKLIIPLLINIPFFLLIYEFQKINDYNLAMTFLFLGILNIFIGISFIYIFSKGISRVNHVNFKAIMRSNFVVENQSSEDFETLPVKFDLFTLVFIIIGILFFIGSMFTS